MSEEITKLASELKEATGELKNWKAKQEQETAQHGEALDETKAKIEAAEAKQAELIEQFGKMDDLLKELQAKGKRPGYGADERKTLGDLFVESDVYEGMKSTGRASGHPVEMDRKDITGTTGSAISLVNPSRDPNVYRSIGGFRATRIRDLVPSVPTATGAVEVMRYTSVDDQSGPQQPSTPSTNQGAGEFEAKNKSSMVFNLVTIPVRTIAHYMAASRQVLSDAGMLRGIIDTELAYGLQLESDFQLLRGDGTNQNLTGILEDAAINDVGGIGAVDPDEEGAAMISLIRAAITQCQLSEYYNVNGLVLNPLDWEKLETAKATDGHYILTAFAASTPETTMVWRTPVVVTNAMPQGQFLIGDWTLGATLYERESVSVRVSESHSDFFVKNGVAILGEERYCLGINRPLAFTTGQFPDVSS